MRTTGAGPCVPGEVCVGSGISNPWVQPRVQEIHQQVRQAEDEDEERDDRDIMSNISTFSLIISSSFVFGY